MESCLNQYMVSWLSFCSHVRNFLLPTCVMRYFGVWKTAVSKRSEKERSRIQTSSRRWPGWRQLRHSGGWGPQCPGLTCSQEAERHTADEPGAHEESGWPSVGRRAGAAHHSPAGRSPCDVTAQNDFPIHGLSANKLFFRSYPGSFQPILISTPFKGVRNFWG